jgi:hypothetical protein
MQGDKSAEKIAPQSPRKPYTRPELTTHGDAQSLTQLVPIGGSGFPRPD